MENLRPEEEIGLLEESVKDKVWHLTTKCI